MLRKLKSCLKPKKQKAVEIPLDTLQGVFTFTHIPFPEKAVDRILAGNPYADRMKPNLMFGFYVAKTIISLYAIEILLKHAHHQVDKRKGEEIKSRHGHNIVKLFNSLPKQEKHDIGAQYKVRAKMIINDKRAEEIMPMGLLIKKLRGHPITDMRYFWERPKGRELPNYHNDLEALSYGIAVGVCKFYLVDD